MKYIHCSFDIVNKFTLRIPTTRCKIEDDFTPRICVAPDIRSCLAAMPDAGKIIEWTRAAGLPVILHAYYLTADKVLEDTTDLVGDAKLTHEMWLLEEPKTIRRVDYEITACTIQDGKDALGDDIKRILFVEIKRVPFTDNLKELFCFSTLNPYDFDIPFGKIAANMSIEEAKKLRSEREKYKKHKAFEGLQRRVAAYRKRSANNVYTR